MAFEFEDQNLCEIEQSIATPKKLKYSRRKLNKNNEDAIRMTIKNLSTTNIVEVNCDGNETQQINSTEQEGIVKEETQSGLIEKEINIINNLNENLKHKLTKEEKYVIVKYLKTERECALFSLINKDSSGVLKDFSYNPVSISNLNLFCNITCLVLYRPKDPVIKNKQIERIISNYPTSYGEAECLWLNGIESTKIVLTKKDIELNGLGIPEDVDVIGENCFSECFNLRYIPFPPSVHLLERFSFSQCNSLTTIIIPSSITSIGEGCFSECHCLERLFLSDNLTIIGNDCFNGCSKLTSIKIEGNNNTFIATIPYWIYLLIEKENKIECVNVEFTSYDRKLFGDRIPQTVKIIGDFCFANSDISAIEVPSEITCIKGSCFANCSLLKQITLPKSLVDLSFSSFLNCSSLTSVTLSNGLKELKDSTFSKCYSLITIYLPSSLTKLESCCFSYCTSLETIEIPSQISYVGDQCFAHCSSLQRVFIPDSLTNIGNECFINCVSLENIVLLNVTTIPQSCFENCSKLLAITIPQLSLLSPKCFKNCVELQAVVWDFNGKRILFSEDSFDSCKRLNQETQKNLRNCLFRKEGSSEIGNEEMKTCSIV